MKEGQSKRIEGVILDWAGTTVDFGCFAPVQAFLDAFLEDGLEPTLDEVRKPMGMLKRDHVKTMLCMPRLSDQFLKRHSRAWDETDVERIYRRSEENILNSVARYTDPKPYVLETIKRLRDRQILIGSTTGYTDEMMHIVVEHARDKGYEPDFWCTPDSVGKKGRPNPDMIYHNMKTLGLQNADCIVKVGDTVSDILEGKNAGVITVGVVEGSSVMGLSEEEFLALGKEEYQMRYEEVKRVYREAGADFVISNIGELMSLIEKIEKD